MINIRSRDLPTADALSSLGCTSGAPHTKNVTRGDKCQSLPSTRKCILHLRLLTAFSILRQKVATSDGQFGTSKSGKVQPCEQIWTIFVANAVARFERWYLRCLQAATDASTQHLACSEEAETQSLQSDGHSFDWSKVPAPPLDVLMVLHSYMLNPRDFLQDCLRRSAVALWKTGFPWNFLEAFLNPNDFSYHVPESMLKAYEQATGDEWDVNIDIDTRVSCAKCDGSASVAWSELYTGDLSQMEKGNTAMSFALACSKCQTQITQSSLCISRFEKDLGLLLDHNVPMPGTLLGIDGQIQPAAFDKPRPLLLNDVLQSAIGQELRHQLRTFSALDDVSKISEYVTLRLENAITEPWDDEDFAEGQNSAKDSSGLKESLRRIIAVYDKNASPFALDLVGAVMRQGAFIDKMAEFDWIHSPALNIHTRFAIVRYAGFFEVMQRHPNKIAVPTFDVDLIWHTHQLIPQNYYDFSLEYCNGVFIDHDDKIVDNILSNSFEWTCEQYDIITGLPYDKCLCWCCALLEADCHASSGERPTSNKVKQKIKNVFARFSGETLSEAEMKVMQIQATKFEKEYAEATQEENKADSCSRSKRDFFEHYIWHYPMYAPSPKLVAA